MAINTSDGNIDDFVLQIVRASSDTFSALNTNTWGSNPVGTVNITPKSTSSLIMIHYTACVSGTSANDIAIRILANGSAVQNANNGRNLHGAMQATTPQNNWAGANSTCTFWHEPSTTSQVGYQIQHRMQTGGGSTVYFNGTAATSVNDSWGSRSFLTLVEYAQN